MCRRVLSRGDIAFDLGDAAEALAGYERALRLVENPDSGMTPPIAEGALPHVLGRTAQALGRVGRRDEAVPMMVRAVELFGRMQVFIAQARSLRVLAEELYGEDDAAQARDSLLQATDVCTKRSASTTRPPTAARRRPRAVLQAAPSPA